MCYRTGNTSKWSRRNVNWDDYVDEVKSLERSMNEYKGLTVVR